MRLRRLPLGDFLAAARDLQHVLQRPDRPVVREQRVRRRDFVGRRLEHAERNRRIGFRRNPDTEFLPKGRDAIVPGRLRDMNGRQVTRVRERMTIRDQTVVGFLVVLR